MLNYNFGKLKNKGSELEIFYIILKGDFLHSVSFFSTKSSLLQYLLMQQKKRQSFLCRDRKMVLENYPNIKECYENSVLFSKIENRQVYCI